MNCVDNNAKFVCTQGKVVVPSCDCSWYMRLSGRLDPVVASCLSSFSIGRLHDCVGKSSEHTHTHTYIYIYIYYSIDETSCTLTIKRRKFQIRKC